MTLWRCTNDKCRFRTPFEAAEARCPTCRLPYCVRLVAVHYLVPAEGPIQTGSGPRMVACEPKRDVMPEAATGERPAVTCPKCRASEMFAEDERDGTDNYVPILDNRIGTKHL